MDCRVAIAPRNDEICAIARPQAVAIHVLMRERCLSKVWLFAGYLQYQLAKILAIK
jgi:hypothetical protein